jgi:hypothetical protein
LSVASTDDLSGKQIHSHLLTTHKAGVIERMIAGISHRRGRLMAGFGITTERSDAVNRALHAAQMMMSRSVTLAESWLLRFEVSAGLGIGSIRSIEGWEC